MITPYFLNLIAGNAMHSNSVAPIPANYYVALSTTTPAEDGTGLTEVTGGAYARSAFGSGSAPGDGLVTNLNDVEFQEATANWGTVKAFGIYDSVVGGNLLAFDVLQDEQVIVTGNQVRFKPGALKLKFRAV